MSLYQSLCNALRDARQVAVNGYLQLLAAYVKDIEDLSSSDPILSRYCSKMKVLVQRRNFALDGNAVCEFCQLFGEAHFLTLARSRGVSLSKVLEEKDSNTPDFIYPSQEPVYFEVKTLSTVRGGRGINENLDDALDAQIEIQRQLQKGRRIANSESIIQPYGTKPCHGGHIAVAINTLIEKTRQNIKIGQFTNPNTFLVLNLCILRPACSRCCALRPSYCDASLFPTSVTGDLWMLAFARVGMLVQGIPDSEGASAVQGRIEKIGILADPEFNRIAGLLIVAYPLGQKPSIYGLFRNSDHSSWLTRLPGPIVTLTDLTGQYWNDDADSNGWQLPNS